MLKKILLWLGLIDERENDPTLDEILKQYSVVDVVQGTKDHGPFVVVTERSSLDYDEDPNGYTFVDPEKIMARLPVVRPQGGDQNVPQNSTIQLRESPQLGEIGSASPSPYTERIRKEYLPALFGLNGLETYHKMRNDGVIASTLTALFTPVNAGRWFMEPADDSKINENIADFIWDNLMNQMTVTFSQVREDALLCAPYGFFIFEKVWENRVVKGKERTILHKLAPRHPMDVKEIIYDKHGGPEAVVFFVKDEKYGQREEKIDISKLLIITHKKEAGDLEGRSVLRPMYKHWFFKDQLYKIDAIQKERHGIGVPVIKLPPSWTDADKAAANELGRNLRTNERAHVVLPPFWELVFAKLEGQPVNAMESIKYHDQVIREAILAGFLGSEQNTKEEDLSLFLKSTRSLANSICDAFNLYLIPDMVKYNFDRGDYPKLRVRQIGEQADQRVISFSLRNLIGAGVIRPDDRLEEYIRDVFDLPKADIATIRVVNTPQAGQAPPATMPNATPGGGSQPATGKTDGTAGSTGLPRQTPVPSVGTGTAGVGKDTGGQS